MFKDYTNFEEKLKKLFGGIDEERLAERRLYQLKQTESVSKYYAEFRKVTVRLNWDDEILIFYFERELKRELR